MFKQSFKLYYRLSPYHEIQRIYLQLEILIGQNIMKLEPSVISVVTSNIAHTVHVYVIYWFIPIRCESVSHEP